MLIAVDGTGPFSNKEYEVAMSDSFIRQICRNSTEVIRSYKRGPSLIGLETAAIAREAFNEIARVYKNTKAENFKLFLAGYSRGGAAVIHLANLLQLELPAVKIDCLALFDAVNRVPAPELTQPMILTAIGFKNPYLIPYGSVDQIPNNVKVVYHALRDPSNKSRWYFGNCGTAAVPSAVYSSKKFNATHAGLGGMPWTGDKPTMTVPNPKFNLAEWVRQHPLGPMPPPSVATMEVPTITKEQDYSGAYEVASWMSSNLMRHGMISSFLTVIK